MSWKKKFAPNARYEELPTLEPFRIDEEPESLGKGKYRCKLITQSGQEYQLTTYESTIGDINYAGGKDGHCQAYIETVNDEDYIRFRSVE